MSRANAGRIVAGIWALFCLLLTVPALALSALSGFMFDAPGSLGHPILWALAIGIWTAPIAFIVGVKRGLRAATNFSWPLLVAAIWPIAVVIAYLAAIVGIGLLIGIDFGR